MLSVSKQLTIILTFLKCCLSLDPADVALAINSGGGTYTSTFGFVYSPDSYYTTGGPYVDPSSTPIARTNNGDMYKSQRVFDGTWGYDIPVSPDGTYVLILQYVETWFTTANARVFTIKIGDYTVLSNLDLFALFGRNNAHDIFIEFTLSAGNVYIGGNLISGAFSAGILNFRMIQVIQAPEISGFILIKGNCAVADHCNMCYKQRCATCNEGDLSCATCIDNAHIVDGDCQCNSNAYWAYSTRSCEKCDNLCNVCSGSANFLCTTCVSPNVLVSSVCLRACPYGFGSCTIVSMAVIEQNFANLFVGTYGIFRVGSNPSTFYFFNSPEADDPIPAKSRGLYFYGAQYLQTSSSIYISLNFSIGFWVWILSGSGDIMANSPGGKITISALGVMTIVLESRFEATATITTVALNPSNSNWIYISFITSFSPSTITTTIVPYLNNSPKTPTTISQYIYRDGANNVIILGKSSSSTFLGYIYWFTLWNVAVSDFNTQYSDEICDPGEISNCLWTCPLSQWMNHATPTNCNSCSNGCVRSISCNVCDDPLCSQCTGFSGGLCTQCVSNASGASSTCTCNAGYVLSSDGFSCLPCFSGCSSCSSTQYYQCLTCDSTHYLLNVLCDTQCPSGYSQNSGTNKCDLTNNLVIDLEFDDYIVLGTLSGFNVGNSNTNSYPNFDTNDSIPAIHRGYYFTGQSYMGGSIVFSPYFSVMLWVKAIDQGVLIEKFDGSVKYLVIKIDSSGYQNLNILLKDGSSLNAISPQYILSNWHYLSFSGSINSDGTYSSYSYIDSSLQFTATSTPKTYLRDSTSGTLLIGVDHASTTGFKGFLWNLKIYNDKTYVNSAWVSTTCTVNPCTSCPVGNFCPSSCSLANYPGSTSCASCKSSSCSYGCRSDLTCRLCREKECYSCISFSNKCLSCITNAGFVGDLCQCNLNAYWNGNTETCDLCHTICTSCSGPSFIECIQCGSFLLMLSNICLEFCPSGYTISGDQCILSNELVFSLRLSQIKDIVYDSIGNVAFQTGNDKNFYPFYTPEDPYAAELRGYYFRGTSFMKSIDDPPSLTFGAEFTISAWINPALGTGYLISKQDSSLSSFLTFSLSSGKLNFSMKLNDGTTVSYMTSALLVTLGSWNFIAVKSIISPTPQQKISFYIDSSSESSSDLRSSWYQDISSSFFISIGAGSDLNTNLYKGFLWGINIYNINEPISSIIISGTCSGCSLCPIELSNSCIPNCDLPYYPNSLTCAACQTQCGWGCVRNDKNCNLCQDVICLVCDDYSSTCITCRDHAYLSLTTCVCYDGYYWDLTNEECTPCDYTCKTCTSAASEDCIICASGFFMYLGLCVSKCPAGYIESAAKCIEKDTFIFYLSFDTLEGVVLDKQSKIPALTGNSTAFYPNYDEFDPIAALYRGFYFNGMNSVMHLPIYQGYNSPVLSFGYSFTFSIWVNIENGFGTILSKQDLLYNSIFSLQLSAGYVVISLNFKVDGLIYFSYLQDLGSYEWNHIAFTAEYTSLKQTKMAFYLNGKLDNQRELGFDYFKDTKTDTSFTLGAFKDNLGYFNYFKGFIYDIKGYNSVRSISSLVLPTAQCTENCKACLNTGACIPNCLISQYWIGPQYNKCSKCNSACLSCRDSSKFCNLCYNPKCTSCLDFSENSCLECISGTSNITNCQCDYGLAWNSSSGICESCHQWQYKANDSCYNCPPLCAQCDSETKCTWCISHAALNSGSCACSPGYIGTTECTYIPFNASLIVNKNNTLILIFSDVLKQDLKNDQIFIQIHNITIPSWSISQISNTQYLISCNFEGGISKGTTIIVHFINSTSIISISGGVIYEEYLSGSLYASLMTSEEQEVAQIQKQVSSGVKVLVGSSVALAMLNPNPSGLWTLLNTIQLLSYIPYASYPLSDKVSAFFKSINDFNLVPNLFLLFIDENNSKVPYSRAKKYGYDSYLLLVNIGNDATILCGIITIIPLVYYFSKCSQRFIGKKLQKILKEYKFDTFLRFWIISYLEIGFAAIIGVLSTEYSEILENSLQLTNYLLCWFLVIFITITPLLHSYFTFKNMSKIINKRNKKWLVPWSSLYYEFKNNSGFLSTQYYALFFTRRLIFIGNQVFLNDFPQSQLTINAVSSLCIPLFLIFYKPFDDLVLQVTNLITEFGIFIIFLLLIPYFLVLGSTGTNILDNLIMYFVALLMAVQTSGPFINSLKEVYYTARRAMKKNFSSNPAKISKNERKIVLGNFNEFFNDTEPTDTTE
ncbi:unnamed protein product [Blepharisma stoltei]|uniref:TNFR-Cys domain-containing protein n=1 Tax=Blepharisma stoltei TaxID=1481888 RepID=A0AAU9IMI1_9CILI|nr:unnamed protein product [Blepharisma stoltei]